MESIPQLYRSFLVYNIPNRRRSYMSRAVYELQGFAVILDKVALVSRVFDADNAEGFQFNITFSTDLRLPVKYPTRHEADLERQLFLSAVKSS